MVAGTVIVGIVVLVVVLSVLSARQQKRRLTGGDRLSEPYDPSTDASANYQAIRDRSTFSGGGPFPH
jgi:hypothetical protein